MELKDHSTNNCVLTLGNMTELILKTFSGWGDEMVAISFL